jgi:nicotinamide riboside transporter PnuC
MGNFWVRYPLVNEDMSLNVARIILLAVVAGAWAAVCIFVLSQIGWINAADSYFENVLLVIICSVIAVLGGVLASIRKS